MDASAGQNRIQVWTQEWCFIQGLDLPDLSGIEVTRFDWRWQQFHDELRNAAALGTLPDVVEIGNTWTARLAQDGLLLDLTRFAVEELDANNRFFDRTLFTCRDIHDASRFRALPVLADVQVLLFNRQDLRAVGHHQNSFRDWDSFAEVCWKIRSQLQKLPLAWPHEGTSLHACLPFIWAGGGDLISLEGTNCIESDGTRLAIERLADLVMKDCAPRQRDSRYATPGDIRTSFGIGNVSIIPAGFWITHQQDWEVRFGATLYPPSPFNSAFVGGSHFAIVRKYGDEGDPRYLPAKRFLKRITDEDNQIQLASSIGKLPANTAAWQAILDRALDPDQRSILRIFDRAIRDTSLRGLPNLLNYAQVEQELKDSLAGLWEAISREARHAATKSIDEQAASIRHLVRSHLVGINARVSPYLTGFTDRVSWARLNQIGTRPEQLYQLCLEPRSPADPTRGGQVYVRGRGLINTGIGRHPFAILYLLATAPERTLTRDQLAAILWPVPEQARATLVEKTTELKGLLERLASKRSTSDAYYLTDLQRAARLAAEVVEQVNSWFSPTAIIEQRERNENTFASTLARLNRQLEDMFHIRVVEALGNLRYRLNPRISVCLIE